MESDNTLCVPLTELERIAETQLRYFVGTGIGASGWIMSRSFLLDFMARYEEVVLMVMIVLTLLHQNC